MSSGVKREMGIRSIVRLLRTVTQYGRRYSIAPSSGVRERMAGSVKRNASRQNAYAIKSAGKKVPNALARSGGFDLG